MLQIVGKYFNERNVGNITEDMLVEAAKVLDARTFGQALMEKLSQQRPELLYQFIVGWKRHFVDTLKPKRLKQHWFEDGNKRLRDILGVQEQHI